PTPSPGSSALDQNVPSKNTQSASVSAASTEGVTAATPEKYASRLPLSRSRILKPTLSSASGGASPSRCTGGLPGTGTASTTNPLGISSAPAISSSRPSVRSRHVT